MQSGANFDDAPGTQGEVSLKSMGKTASSAVGNPPDAKPGHPRTTGNTADQNRLTPCTGKPFELSNESSWKVKKEIPDKSLERFSESFRSSGFRDSSLSDCRERAL